MATLQEHYNQINEGKGNKAQFLKQARALFPQHFNQYSDFNTVTNVLKSKQIISESKTNVVTKGFDIYNWKKILAEEVKAEEKTTSKGVIDIQKHAYDNVDMKNADNINFNEIMKGFYAELKDPKNHDKTGDEIKAMVVKNLAKDCLHYTKDGMFGEKGLGFTTEAPGLGTPKEPKGKFKSSGYGDLDTEVKIKEPKSNTQDSLGDKEAKTSDPKKVKEMPTTPQNSAGVKKMKTPGTEKTMKLQEGVVNENEAVYDQIADLEHDLMLAKNDEHKAEIEAKIKSLEAELLKESKLISLVRTMIRESLNEGANDWNTLFDWLKQFSTDKGEFLSKNNISSGVFLEKKLTSGEVKVEDLDKIAKKDGTVFSKLPVYNRNITENETDLDARLKKYVENEVPTGNWKSIKNYYREMTQDKPDPKRRYFELVDGILKKHGY
jgi:hypothetical protein